MKKLYTRQFFIAMLALLCSVTATAHDFEVDGIYYNVTDEANLTVEVTFKGEYYHSYYDEYTEVVVIPASVSYNGKSYSVTSIGESAFWSCTGLTSVTIPNSVTSIGNYSFDNCYGLTSVTIPNSVTSIGYRAFYSCSGLTSVTIPNSVTSIGGSAFEDCTGLTSITIPNSVTSIGNSAFYGCKALTSITIPNSVTSIGNGAFYGCEGLTSITIPNSVTSIGYGAFEGCRGLTSVTIPNSVTSIGDDAFRGCKGFTSVTIGNSVTSIGDGAFYNCNGLTSIVVEEGNKKYDSRNNCNAIIETETNTLIKGCNTTVIPEDVTSIGSSAFNGCYGLTSITIPNSVTSIGSSAFNGCTRLTSVTIPNSVTSIGESVFANCTRLTSITIPNSVTSIGDYAFANCTGLTSITIPNSVTSIGDGTFYYCSGLTSVTIGNSVTSIGYAFEGCRGLTAVYISDLAAWCKIDFGDFYSNPLSFAKNLYLNGEKVTDLVIPESVTEIKAGAFYYCSGLTSVTIPNSVTSIGDGAFIGCKGLTSIYMLSGTPAVVTNVTFSSNYINTTLYVPYGSLEAYKAATGWKYFENIVEFDATGIEDVTEDAPAFEITADGIQLTAAEGKAVAVYTAGGALVEKIDSYAGEEIMLGKGVYIIRVGGRAVKARF